MTGDKPYVLGHTEHEIRRLELQATLLGPPTLRLLQATGLKPGMSVLDVGTGAGDVAMLAAGIVGPQGSVVGIDRSEAALARARARAGASGHANIRFEVADLVEADVLGRFDLVVGRFVLLFQLDKPAFLRAAAGLVRPSGALALIEPMAGLKERYSTPPVPLHDWTVQKIVRAFDIGRAEVDVGRRLTALFHEAGLPEPRLSADLLIGGPSSPVPDWVSATLESLAPALRAAGELDDMDFVEHATKMREAAVASSSQLYGPHAIGAWVRLD